MPYYVYNLIRNLFMGAVRYLPNVIKTKHVQEKRTFDEFKVLYLVTYLCYVGSCSWSILVVMNAYNANCNYLLFAERLFRALCELYV